METPAGDVTTYAWDYENRNTSVSLPAGDTVTLAYNGDLVRVSKEDATDTVRYIWEGGGILLETDALNVVLFENTHQPVLPGRQAGESGAAPTGQSQNSTESFPQLISRHDATAVATSFYHFDALGSTRALTDSAEVTTDDYVYYAFGEVKSSSGSTSNPYQWIGQLGYYFDEDLSRHHVRAREYDPAPARFISKDPLGLDAGDSNLYRYVGNNPASAVGRQFSGIQPRL